MSVMTQLTICMYETALVIADDTTRSALPALQQRQQHVNTGFTLSCAIGCTV